MNWFLIVCVCMFDMSVCKNKIQFGPFGFILNLWCLCGFISIPAYLIWLIF